MHTDDEKLLHREWDARYVYVTANDERVLITVESPDGTAPGLDIRIDEDGKMTVFYEYKN